MPTAPVWFQAIDYFYNKLAQARTTDSGYTAQQLMDSLNAAGYGVSGLSGEALNASADGLYRHFNDSGNADNVSPNNFFDVSVYRANKLAQVQQTGQAVPEGFPAWSEAALDALMARNGVSYWDHYILAGTEEGINPSAAFNTNAYLEDKLAQLNSLEPPQPLPNGSAGPWTRADLCQVMRDGGGNAIQHYMLYNTSEGIHYTPGPENPAVQVPLTSGTDVISDDGVPTNYTGLVSSRFQASTLNPDDQISGGNGDALTVGMTTDWTGFNPGGFAKGITAVNLTNQTATNQTLTFNANNITDTTTWNVNGNVALANLPRADVTVNLNGVTNAAQYELYFAPEAVTGGNDKLTLGVTNMPEYVTIRGNGGIEEVTVNSTGVGSNYVWLRYMDGVNTVKITGDDTVELALSKTVKFIDGTGSDADNFVCTKYSDLVESIKMGSGDNGFTLRKLLPDAFVDGGDGNDSASLYNTIGTYQLNMNSVETLNIRAGRNYADQERQDPTAGLVLDGSHTTGFQNLKLGGGNGYLLTEDGTASSDVSQSRPITLLNYDLDQLPIAVSGKNDVNMTINGIKDITVNVGDGTDSTTEILKGKLNLPDATAVAINVSDTNADTSFSAVVSASAATTLELSNTEDTTLALLPNSNLKAVSDLTVSGRGDITIQSSAHVGENAKYVTVDAHELTGGTFESSFVNNTAGGATLDFTGSTTGKSVVNVDATYSRISIDTGLADDVVSVNGNDGYKFTTQNLSGDLGAGNDTLIVKGTILDGSDFSGLSGVEMVQFENMTTEAAKAFISAHNITVGDGVAVTGSASPSSEVSLVGSVNPADFADLAAE